MVALESARLFRNLKPEELAALRRVAQEKTYPAGQDIFREGDPGDGVYVVKDGVVEIYALPDRKTRRVFSQVGPGDIFGEMAVIEHRPRSAAASAARDTQVYFIPRAEMLSLVERSPGLAMSLLQEISARLREFDQQHIREVVQAEQLALVGRFARSIVHDLKNPLTIISLTAEMACKPDATPAARTKAYERIHKQMDRITDLVGEILQFTQGTPPTGTQAQINYATFVQQLAEDLRSETELRGVKLELANKPPSALLALNPKRLRRLFFNLANNAMDAMSNGGKLILRFKQDAKEVTTEVEDTGPGIAPEVADKLFQVFATHGKAHGTGLGLSICKKIVEDHGGRIWTRKEPGRGAIFAFSLPLP
jgi:signal transduction histidine kinase